MIRQFFILMYKLTGWKIIGKLPEEKKYLLIVAPHTSYWDFPVGIAARSILRMKANFLGKAELFRIPVVGWALRKMGGYPVVREKNTNMVDYVVNMYKEHESLVIVLAPEGTRAYVPKLKTGFYYMAKNAGVPLVMCGFDFKKKTVEIKEPIYLTDNFDEDMEYIMSYFRGVTGKFPEQGIR